MPKENYARKIKRLLRNYEYYENNPDANIIEDMLEEKIDSQVKISKN